MELFVCWLLVLFGCIGALWQWKNLLRYRRVLAIPTSRVSDAPGNAPVEIQGHIVPGDQGIFQAPFTGRPAVWARVRVQEHHGSHRNFSSYWSTIIDETYAAPFYVDDQSGQRARIEPLGANMEVDRAIVARSSLFNDVPPNLYAFLAWRNVNPLGLFGTNRALRFDEQLLAPNFSLRAIGPSRRRPGHNGSRLVMFAAPGRAGELILTDKTEKHRVSGWMWKFVGSLLLALAGLVILLVDLLMHSSLL